MHVHRGRPVDPVISGGAEILRGELEITKPAQVSRPLPPQLVSRLDKTTRTSKTPGEYRLLAAIRFWNVIHYFFPYQQLIREGWDSVLEEFIPKLESARDAREYALTLAEMATHTHDSHVSVRGKAMTEYFGAGEPGGRATRDRRAAAVVTRLAVDGSVKESGTQVGDIILKVDGEPVRERDESHWSLHHGLDGAGPHGTVIPWSGCSGGLPGSSVTVTVRDHDGHNTRAKA